MEETEPAPRMVEPALDRAMFRTVFSCIGLRIRNQDVTLLQQHLGKKSSLNILFHQNKRIKNVLKDDTSDQYRILLLDPLVTDSWKEDAPKQAEGEKLKSLIPSTIPFETCAKIVEVNYEHLLAEDVLRKLLPSDVEVPSGFETIGHIAHLNLRPEHEPYKHRIGQVIIDKSTNVKTVVNKTGIIETQFRTFPMEVLAGPDDMNVDVRMNGFRFKFNFAKVYWNSRLSDEHDRLVSKRFNAGDIVVDGFCGVGPFAVRAAKKGCAVAANDLNPESVASLVENAQLNKVDIVDRRSAVVSDDSPISADDLPTKGKILAYNSDAREFMRFMLKGLPPMAKTHIVMNLPATAPEFLDSLLGSLDRASGIKPMIHCYCFSTGADIDSRKIDVTQRINSILGLPPSNDLGMELRDVRDVAPNKYMVCAHFEFPEAITYKVPDAAISDSKKQKTSGEM